MTSSTFDNFLKESNPQIKHNRVFFNIDECLIVRCSVADHPDPCLSFRYENYDSSGKLSNAFVFLTDHEMRESDNRNSYFLQQVNNCDAVYLDGQYEEKNYVPGFGHGRVEVIGETMAGLNVKNVLIGHHDPQRTDDQIDRMIALAQQHYSASFKGDGPKARIVGAADRMMIFIPGKQRRRDGIVYGRMNIDKGYEIQDDIGSQSSVISQYSSFDLTQVYTIEDFTREH